MGKRPKGWTEQDESQHRAKLEQLRLGALRRRQVDAWSRGGELQKHDQEEMRQLQQRHRTK